MKYIFFVLDGAADESLPELGNVTPLRAARTPTMDRLCARSVCGRVRGVPQGVAPGTESAFLTFFGAEAAGVGRAYMEAYGMGLSLDEGEYALRCNIIGVADYKIASHNGDDVCDEEARALISDVLSEEEISSELQNRGMRIMFGEGFRHILAIKSPSPDTTPPHEIIGEPYYNYFPEGWDKLLTKISMRMDDHPVNVERRAQGRICANMLWPWGGGLPAKLPDFYEWMGVRGACIAAAPLVKGIARISHIETPDVLGATARLDTDWRSKVDCALRVLDENDFVLLHIEATDECSHMGNVSGKIEGIEMADAMLSRLCEKLDKPFRLLVTADHYTYLKSRSHGAAPTPYFLYDSRTDTGCGATYDECIEGEIVPGGSIIARLLSEKE